MEVYYTPALGEVAMTGDVRGFRDILDILDIRDEPGVVRDR
jgi:hypothetical protein